MPSQLILRSRPAPLTLLRLSLAAMLCFACARSSSAVTPKDFTKETPAQRAKRMAWFEDARFGMFIHWGLYAVPAGEWKGKAVPGIGEWIMETAKIPPSEYEPLAKQFNPVQFNADEWVRIAKDAGMKYIVITSKHHDGFGLWPSALGDWNIRRTPFQRDPLKELSDACRKAGIRLCFYHSIMDWHHPDWGTRRPWYDLPAGEPDMDRYVEYMKGQLKELITRYGPLGILWFDGEWERAWTHERAVDLYNYVRSLRRTSSSTTASARDVPACRAWTRARAWATTAHRSSRFPRRVSGRACLGNPA